MKTFKTWPRKRLLILIVVLAIWAIFSLLYIGYNIWGDFKVNQMNRAYQQGRIDTVVSLINSAEAECSPFSVTYEGRQVDLINVSCLEQANDNQNQNVRPEQDIQPQIEPQFDPEQ